jgi:uncharacterized membrane protein YraQ (UPF0718 family)
MTKTKYVISVSVSLIIGLTVGLLFNRQRTENFELEKERIVQTFRGHDYQRQILKEAETKMWAFSHNINSTLNNAWKNGVDKVPKDSLEFMVDEIAMLTDLNLRLFVRLDEMYQADSIFITKLGAQYAPVTGDCNCDMEKK